MKRHSWIGRINTTIMVILLKSIYRFNAMPIKIPKSFFVDIEKSTQKFTRSPKRSQRAKVILSRKVNTGSITIPDFKLNHTATGKKQKQNKQHGIGTKTGTKNNETEQKTQKYNHKTIVL
jgi:hypothetical protein